MSNSEKSCTDRCPVADVAGVEPAAAAGAEIVRADAHLSLRGLERLERRQRVRGVLEVAGGDDRPAQTDLAAMVARDLYAHLRHVHKPRLHTRERAANVPCNKKPRTRI